MDKEKLKVEIKDIVQKVFNEGDLGYWVGQEIVDKIRELIDQLDEPETLSQEWIEDNKKDSGVHYIGYYVPIGRLQNLLVPKQDKVVVPAFVAEWYEEWKEDLTQGLFDLITSINFRTVNDEPMAEWITSHSMMKSTSGQKKKYEI